ncbi:ankyrin repeat domain-containing protein [bacterium]|nr:MAG: ankyrin repeat domain-containing protein [bacterium]
MNIKILSLFLITLACVNNAKSATTALHEAADNGNVAELERLLATKQFNIEAQDVHGLTSLHYAAWKNQPPCITTLLQHGANVNIKDQHHWTPLHFAAFCGHYACAIRLVNGGADISAATDEGKTPVMLAACAHKFSIVEYLHKKELEQEQKATTNESVLTK